MRYLIEKATKCLNRILSTDSQGKKEACRRAFLRLFAKKLDVEFDPGIKINGFFMVNAEEEWGVKIEIPKIIIMPVS